MGETHHMVPQIRVVGPIPAILVHQWSDILMIKEIDSKIKAKVKIAVLSGERIDK
ncbi:hypothetical protein DSO57_1012064, partial [Entomophthora muscae]